MTDISGIVESLLGRSAKLPLFAMLRRTVRPALLGAHLADHLRWMIGEEAAGRIFLSGPFAPPPDPAQPGQAGAALDGLTIIRAADHAAAARIAAADPFVLAGVVTFELRAWTVNEGAITLTVTLSDSAVRFP